jgi:hypothetical protein
MKARPTDAAKKPERARVIDTDIIVSSQYRET